MMMKHDEYIILHKECPFSGIPYDLERKNLIKNSNDLLIDLCDAGAISEKTKETYLNRPLYGDEESEDIYSEEGNII